MTRPLRMRRFVRTAITIFTCLAAAPLARAQEAYVAGSAGLGVGGGTSAEFSGSAGYLTSKHFGLEIEISGRPDVDLDVPPVAVPVDSPGAALFPQTQRDVTAHLLSFHTSAVVPLVEHRGLRVSAVAGGGVATLTERIHVHRDAFEFPGLPFPGFPGLPELPGLTIPAIDATTTASHTALSLQAGGTLDYSVGKHASVGADARYQHAFISGQPLNLGRIAARVRWRF